jgi:hypothetical protein
MTWISFIEEHYPERDFTDFTIWEIGDIDFNLVYPNLPVFRPEYIRWLEDIEYLPTSMYTFTSTKTYCSGNVTFATSGQKASIKGSWNFI